MTVFAKILKIDSYFYGRKTRFNSACSTCARPGGGTHFRVEVVSRLFEGKSRLARQRMVYAALADEMKDRLHALSLKTLTPAEDASG